MVTYAKRLCTWDTFVCSELQSSACLYISWIHKSVLYHVFRRIFIYSWLELIKQWKDETIMNTSLEMYLHKYTISIARLIQHKDNPNCVLLILFGRQVRNIHRPIEIVSLVFVILLGLETWFPLAHERCRLHAAIFEVCLHNIIGNWAGVKTDDTRCRELTYFHVYIQLF